MENTSDTQNQHKETTSLPVPPARLVVFAVLAVGFFVWVVFGQVEARVWVSGELTLLDRPIATMWQYLGNNLPDLPAPGLFSIIYWLSIAFVVIGTIAGLWLFLGTPDNDPSDQPLDVVHAAHLPNDAA